MPAFTVAVKDHVLVAHSLRGAVFGPAQRLHGATYAVCAEFRTGALDADGIVIDIGRAQELLARVLDPLRHRNLDELEYTLGTASQRFGVNLLRGRTRLYITVQ